MQTPSSQPDPQSAAGTPGVVRTGAPACRRVHTEVRGACQGVGFRPFVFRVAREHRLGGWILNGPAGVVLELEGDPEQVEQALRTIVGAPPPMARIHAAETREIAPRGEAEFAIRPSLAAGEMPTATVLPDLATCADCRRELFDPADRRYRYPFTNCTNCGPRYSIIEAIPYDRPNTTMRHFGMCPDCRAEYEDPGDRRFHAQPVACHACGPQLRLLDRSGRVRAHREEALARAAAALRGGQIVAVKGLGGYQLMVDARDDAAVRRLRARKGRPTKPLAIMVADLAAARLLAEITPVEAAALDAPEAPIVLLGGRRCAGRVAESVAPRTHMLGVMLPYTPLHHLLLADLGLPVVATSGNLSEEPMAIDDEDALTRLGGIADLFLAHDRPIARAVDDSVVRQLGDVPTVLRRARGLAPLPLHSPLLAGATTTWFAAGADLKSTIGILRAGEAILSQHLGDLQHLETEQAYERTVDDLCRLFDCRPAAAVCDLHPGYVSSRRATRRGQNPYPLQHHRAHMAAVLAEAGADGDVLCAAWDGTGYGEDGSIWGGEWFRGPLLTAERCGWIAPFTLLGGDQAIREPRRSLLGLAWAAGGAELARDLCGALWPARELANLEILLAAGRQTVPTSSMGRVFDAVACLLGFGTTVSYEGEAALALEAAATEGWTAWMRHDPRPAPVTGSVDRILRPGLWLAPLRELARSEGAPAAAAAFHDWVVAWVEHMADAHPDAPLALSGGVFQNGLLVGAIVDRMGARGRAVFRHRQYPPNDGGIALGQLAWAALAERAARGDAPA